MYNINIYNIDLETKNQTLGENMSLIKKQTSAVIANLSVALGLVGLNQTAFSFENTSAALDHAGIEAVREDGSIVIKTYNIVDLSAAASLDGLAIKVVGPNMDVEDEIIIQILPSADLGQITLPDGLILDESVMDQLSAGGVLLQSDN